MTATSELVQAVLVGGGGTAFGAGFTAYLNRRRRPAEVDSIIVGSAETTVQAALALAAAEASRADRAEERVAERDIRIEAMQAKIEALQAILNDLRSELHALKLSDHTQGELL